MTEDTTDQFERVVAAIESVTGLSVEQRRAIDVALCRVTIAEPRHAERNRLLIELRQRFRSDNHAGHEIASQLRIYMNGMWRFDRTKDKCPYAAGTLRAAFWAILKQSERLLSPDRIRKIVGQTSRVEMTSQAKSSVGQHQRDT